MKISIAKTAGFCMGVRRAVEMVLETSNQTAGPVYTFGPLIHNPQVMGILEEKGVRVLSRAPESGTGTVIIRAHGVTPQVKQDLENAGFDVLDATCPRVIKVQTLLQKHAASGRLPIIVGDEDHPEVQGLLGHTQNRGVVVRDPGEVDNLPEAESAVLVAQTTQDQELFAQVSRKVLARWPDAAVFNTICDSTARRQQDTASLADQVDAMVVVGGKDSGNTRRLFSIAQKTGKPAFHVETEKELDPKDFKDLKRVGLTAGASTPTWIIRRVRHFLEDARVKRNTPWFAMTRAMLLTNLYLAMGAAGMNAAAMLLMGLAPTPASMLTSACFVGAIHTLHKFLEKNAARYNDPDRARFYETYKKELLAGSAGALAASWLLALYMGEAAFWTLASLTLIGLLYNVRLIPWKNVKYTRMRAVPGSKTFGVALAWAVCLVVVPAAPHGLGAVFPSWVLAFFWVGGLVFFRSAFFDVLDVQVDRVVGAETAATWLGAHKTSRVLRRLVAILAGGLLIYSPFGAAGGLALLLLACAALPMAFLQRLKKGGMHPGYRLELLVDTNFILAGLAAGLYLVLTG